VHAQGQPVWVRDWVHPSFDDPRAPKVHGFTFDVNERVNARIELERYREHLENVVAERTAELVEVNKELQSFAHSLSQDLRVPLRIVNGFSQAVLEDYGSALDDQGVDYLRRICAGTEAMGKMINDLLLLSRVTREEMNRKRFNLSEMVEKEVERLRKADPDRQVNISIQPDVMVYADQSLLQIVVEHLISNAWKFTAKTEKPEINFSCETENNRTVYSVSDNGAGFDMQYAENLFLPFRRLHNSEEFEGTGVGLATVKRIILRHGGEIRGEGSVGKGASFYFTLTKEIAASVPDKEADIAAQNARVG
jgi:light-regulated signal transduction histidine kinase (bacteriophytochrome)